MTDSNPVVDVAHPAHNPFDMPPPKRNKGVAVALIATLAVHGLIGYYLYQWKFQAKYQNYADEKTDAQLCLLYTSDAADE